jgi:hypothetical protein
MMTWHFETDARHCGVEKSFFRTDMPQNGVEMPRRRVETARLFAEMAQDLAGQRQTRRHPARKRAGSRRGRRAMA